MLIKEVTIEELKAGKNWRIVNSSEFANRELPDLTIEECFDFLLTDYVVYSALFVSDGGRVTPLVLIKEVGSREHGGDMCEMISGKWQKVGLDPKPGTPVFGAEYVANPLPNDPSFDTGDEADDERAYNKVAFEKLINRLRRIE